MLLAGTIFLTLLLVIWRTEGTQYRLERESSGAALALAFGVIHLSDIPVV